MLKAPTLVLHGALDPIVSLRWTERVTGLLPDGRLVVVPKAAHAMTYNAPSEVARHVRAFVRADTIR